MTLTVRASPGSNLYEFEARTEAGNREAYVLAIWPVVVAAMSAYVESLR